ncbi:protein FAM149A isoform X3 [Ornithorhynchus anatinus]|uniref:protein FAM149A isoform X3 n=1 Tax=Ornithorhynchus anatinus TaxID=9258 RepID=UPI0019D452FB|nr:protein FAM149A isoform X3 [Ornithorhynchus anatinus]
MKVAVLDLGSLLAKIFKTPGGPSAPSAQDHASPLQPSTPVLTSSCPRLTPGGPTLAGGLPPGSLPSSPRVPNSLPGPLPTSPRVPKPSPLLLVPAPVDRTGRGTSSCVAAHPGPLATPARSPLVPGLNPARASRQVAPGDRESGVWTAPAQPGPRSLFCLLPDIGEEWAADTDPEEGPGAQSRGLPDNLGDHRSAGKSRTPLPLQFTKDVQDAIHSYTCSESVSSLSSSGPASPTDLNNSWSGIQSVTTGLSTERSSIYSWRDDDLDRASAQRVQQLLWEVDEALFDGKVSPQTQNLQAECAEWTQRSLHLRVLGRQLLLPSDEGFQHFQATAAGPLRPEPLPSLSESSLSSHNDKQLCISGSPLTLEASPGHMAQESCLPGPPGPPDVLALPFLEEEIIAQEGTMEEYFAFDRKDPEDEGAERKRAQRALKRRQRGLPPVSPVDCIKEAVVAAVFDQAWRWLVGVLEGPIRRDRETALAEGSKATGRLKAAESRLPRLPTSQPASVPPSRGSEIQRFSSHCYRQLAGVMTIQAKPLQQRQTGPAEKSGYEPEERALVVRTSLPGSARAGRTPDSRVQSASRGPAGSSRKPLTHRRLPSLGPDLQRSKTPTVYSDEVLRGTRLFAGLDHLSPPPASMARNKLPPIGPETREPSPATPGSRQGWHRAKRLLSRVSSAVPRSPERQPLSDRAGVADRFSRPNTTHAFRVGRRTAEEVVDPHGVHGPHMGQAESKRTKFPERAPERSQTLPQEPVSCKKEVSSVILRSPAWSTPGSHGPATDSVFTH